MPSHEGGPMIHCPNCEATNPEGSRFCSECGEALPTTGTPCPVCGTINDIGEAYCRECNARLVPMSGKHDGEESGRTERPTQGISLPTDPTDEPQAERGKDEAQDAERGDPPSHDWLDELRGSATEDTEDIKRDGDVDGSKEPLAPPEVAPRLSDSSAADEDTRGPVGAAGQPTEDLSREREDAQADTLLDEPRADSPSSEQQVSPLAGPDTGRADRELTSRPDDEDTTPPPRDIPEWLRGLDATADEQRALDQTLSDEEARDESRQEDADSREAPQWLREMELSTAAGAASDRQSRVDDEGQAIIQIPDWLKEAQSTGPSRPPDELDEESDAHPRVEPEVEFDTEPQDDSEAKRERPPEPEPRREPAPPEELEAALETQPEPEPQGRPEAEREVEPDARAEVEPEAEPQDVQEAEPDLSLEPEPEIGPAPAPDAEAEEESGARHDTEADLSEELVPPHDRNGTDVEVWQEAAASTRLSPESVELPHWVTEAGGWTEEEPTTEETSPPGPAEWTDTELETEEPLPTERPGESVDLPDWIQEAESRPEGSSPEQEDSPFTTATPETTEAPDWLRDLLAPSPAEAGEAPPLPPEPGLAEEERDSDLERADIPEWLLGLRPGQDEKRAVVRGPVETEGLLRGLRGVVPSTSLIAAPAEFDAQPPSGPSEASLARAELFQSILGQAAATRGRETREEAEDTTGLVERWLVAGLLILTVLSRLVVLGTTHQAPRLTQPLTSSSAVTLHRAVDELAAGDQVLVAFDYGPSKADELSPAAQPVLEHVLDRGATLSIVSTRPDGPLVAEGVMSGITDAEDQYTIVGYRPGAASGVSQLLAASDTSPEMLLILTGRALPLRLWVEQARALYGERLPLAAVGSAALEPVASAYLDANAGQLTGAVHGLAGAASYETLQGSVGAATRRLDVLAAGHIAIVVLIVVGAVVHAVGWKKRNEA